ncbi:hypothetical protein VPNG_03003 [Cytospora leucostoma]|uniref:Cytochrome P450 n=1 Tax=Cytospora leucostoma TaxID=1230097 RepID=A0A423XGC3_9PEZI|nr:hypothetical protein VPNG_03003 [Cytospora leucostoma]
MSPRTWSSTWPFGLDMLAQALKYARAMNILQFFVDVVEQNGTTFEQVLLGARGIDTIDPENIEAVLSTNFDVKLMRISGSPEVFTDYGLGLRAVHFQPLLGSGIFTQDGSLWKRSRSLLRPQFSVNRSQDFEQITRCVQDLIDSLPNEGGTVDFQPLFFKLTLKTTMFLLFGDSVSDVDGGEVAGQESEFSQSFSLAQDYLAHRGRLGQFYWLLYNRAFRDACKKCHHFVDTAVDKALRSVTNPGKLVEDTSAERRSNHSFIDTLTEETQMGNRKVFRDQCFNVLLAGRDTTGCCLSWTFRLLARHQHVLEKLRYEIASVCGLGADAEPPTRDQLRQMAYLSVVIKEGPSHSRNSKGFMISVLRLYPSVPVNSREATRMTTLPVGGGPDGRSPVLVRPGEAVGYCVYAMHRRRDIYGEDADLFRPERWEGDELKNVGWAYLPWNGGPRLCLGQHFALLEISYTVCRIIQVFPNITVPPSEPHVDIGKEKQNLTLVVACADGCRLSLSPEL